MKLLLVSPLQQMANGGIAVWTNMFLNATKNTDIETDVLNVAMIGRRLENGSAKRSFFDEIFRTRRIFRSLRSMLKKEKYDVAHINTSCGKYGIARDYMIAKRIKKKKPSTKIVVHYHCDIGYQIKSKRALKYLRLIAGLADENIVLCKSSVDYLARLGVKSTILPNFISDELIRDTKREFSEKITSAFFVGRVQRAKGVMEIFSVAKELGEIEFRLAGAVSAEVAGLTLPTNVSLLGPLSHEEVIAEMDKADIFIFPTYSEGFSIALLESMARGLPSIATWVGANADMLAHGCGEVVPTCDGVAVKEAILRISDSGVRETIGTAAVEKVKREYTERAFLQGLYKIYLGG